MSKSYSLDAQVRELLGKKVKRLRQQGQIPATVYGKGFDPVSIQVDDRAFNALYRQAGRTGLIDLKIDGKPTAVLVQDVQRHPVSRGIIHADFRAVDLKQTMHVDVPVVTVGHSPLVDRGDAIINHVLNTVTVEALPANIPQHVEADISKLTSLDDVIRVSDLATSADYRVLTPADESLISLTQMREVTEEAAEETPAEPELIRKERKDDEE